MLILQYIQLKISIETLIVITIYTRIDNIECVIFKFKEELTNRDIIADDKLNEVLKVNVT